MSPVSTLTSRSTRGTSNSSSTDSPAMHRSASPAVPATSSKAAPGPSGTSPAAPSGVPRAHTAGPACKHVLPLEERFAWDGIDEIKANARGWTTKTFVDLPFRHHRPEGHRDGGSFRARAAQGRAAHYLGYRSWYLVLRAVRHIPRDPGAAGLVWGYGAAAVAREQRCADVAARAYLRRQQSLRQLPLRARETLRQRRRLSA